jgi:uncharacterized membrane protein
MKAMVKIVHPVAGAVAIVTIASFWLSTALSEMFASPAIVAAVKMAYRGVFCCWSRR